MLLTCLFLGIVGTLVLVFHPKEFPNYCWIICVFSVVVSRIVIGITCSERPVAGSRTPLISRNYCYSSESVYRRYSKTSECNRITRDPRIYYKANCINVSSILDHCIVWKVQGS